MQQQMMMAVPVMAATLGASATTVKHPKCHHVPFATSVAFGTDRPKRIGFS